MPAPIYFPSLSHPLTIQAHRTAGTLNPWPESCSNCPVKPMAGSGRPLPSSDAPCILCSQAISPCSYLTCIHIWAGAGRNQCGLSPLPTANFSLVFHDIRLLFQKGHFSSNLLPACSRNLEILSVTVTPPILHQHSTCCLLKLSHPKTNQILCTASLGFGEEVRWFLSAVSEKNLCENPALHFCVQILNRFQICLFFCRLLKQIHSYPVGHTKTKQGMH